jgi:hypothetical protein
MKYPLEKEIVLFESLITKPDIVNDAVSQRGIYWHIDHSLRVIVGVSMSIQRSKEAQYKWSFNASRTAALLAAYFPRGKAKAPDRVISKEEVTVEGIQKLIKTAKTHLKAFPGLMPNQYYEHHLFGMLKKSTTKRFLKTHTKHHIKIIQDIGNL